MNHRVQKWRAMYYPEITDWSAYNKMTNPNRGEKMPHDVVAGHKSACVVRTQADRGVPKTNWAPSVISSFLIGFVGAAYQWHGFSSRLYPNRSSHYSLGRLLVLRRLGEWTL